jgi:hypothetical protein
MNTAAASVSHLWNVQPSLKKKSPPASLGLPCHRYGSILVISATMEERVESIFLENEL